MIKAYAGDTSGEVVTEDILSWALQEDQKGTQLHAYETLTVLALLTGDLEQASANIDKAVKLSAELRLTAATGRLSARQGLVRLLMDDESGAQGALGRAMIDNAGDKETVFLDGLLKVRAGDAEAGRVRIEDARRLAGDSWHLTERLFHALADGS